VGHIEIHTIESSEPWLTAQSDGVGGTVLQVSGQLEIAAKVDLLNLRDTYHQVVVTVKSTLGPKKFNLEVSPKPKFQIITGDTHSVLLDDISDEPMSGYLSVVQGILTVESLTTDVPHWATVTARLPAELPSRLDQRSNNRLEFQFEFNEKFLLDDVRNRGQSLPAEYKGSLLVKFAELREPRKESFRVNCLLPPKWNVSEVEERRLKVKAFIDRRKEVDLTVQNGEREEAGRADLVIHDIKIDAPWVQLSGAVAYPLTIASGWFHELTLNVLTKNLTEGTHPAKITFWTNIPGANRQEVFIDIEVGHMPMFDGVLAIDFGTTNSCCAFLNRFGQVELIPIGEPEDGNQTTVSSAILYRNLFDDNVKDYRIGNGAYEVSFQSTFSAVRQVKRLLGTTNPLEIIFQDNPANRAQYLPRQIAKDIFRRILDRAEEHVGGRIVSCTISHPSRFSLGQMADLKEAIKACGIEKIRTVHEPVGAALDFIRGKEIREGYRQYHLMVFDFGGGTTDITLMHVTNEYQRDHLRTKITPEVLAATGDRWLGGENVTEIVMDLVVDRCTEILKARNPQATNVRVPYNIEDFNSQHRKQLAKENRNKLRHWAEAAKIAISTYGDDHQRELQKAGQGIFEGINLKARLPQSFELAVIVDNVVNINEEFFHDEVVPRQEGLNGQLRPKLEDMADLMRRMAKHHGIRQPDIVLLSGKSSGLPVVEEVIRKCFSSSRIARPNDLKECVVKGACQFFNPDPGPVYIQFKGAKTATTSRLGVRINNPDTAQSAFRSVIDAGVPVGEEGLKERILGLRVDRDTQLRILENTSSNENWLSKNGKWNRNITELKVSSIDPRLTEWEKKHDRRITDLDLEDAKVELVVTPTLSVKLIVSVGGIDEPLEFEADWGGG
jgi:molecular chaperone DnaK (HSP70)